MSAGASSLGTVLVIAKQPRPGRVKTRLTPPCTAEQAADLAAAALYDSLRAASTVPAGQYVLALDGAAGSWLPAGWRVVPQAAGGLDRRLAAAFHAVRDDGPAVLVGMDTPQVTAAQLSAFDPGAYGAALGLACDGGFWAIGFADPADASRTIPGVPMSESTTGGQQLVRLRAAGLAVLMLDTLTDVDTAETAEVVAQQAPHTRFAKTWRRLDVAGEVA